jgi:hypothetical protein
MSIDAIEPSVGVFGGRRYGLEHHGVTPAAQVYWNLSPALLYEEALSRGDGAWPTWAQS